MKVNSILAITFAFCVSTQALEAAYDDSNLANTPRIKERRSALETQVAPEGDACPQVWYDIAKDLKSEFSGCNRRARDAIRFAFHDAAGYSSKNPVSAPASGGADGSLLLNDGEIARSANDPLQGFRGFLLQKYNKYKSKGVGAADFAQAAGSIGTVSCPGGPVVRTVIGRSDSSKAAPDGTLPAAFGPGSKYDVLIQLWAEKGFSPRELAALMGAHSVSKSFAQQSKGIPTGGQQDTTPRSWDVKYYSQTQAKSPPRGVFRFDSDVNLSNPATEAGKAFTEFGKSKEVWTSAYQDAMFKLSVLGIPDEKKASFKDCTAILGAGA
ncbi:hypothetical protein Q7P37_010258 [Cladosporium fusiforme]